MLDKPRPVVTSCNNADLKPADYNKGWSCPMHNWKCPCCGYLTESERCPSCKYANCRGCHLIEYLHQPPVVCPACKQPCEFSDIGDDPDAALEPKVF